MLANAVGKLNKYPLFHILFTLKGNARACVLTEPLFAIPYYMLAPFITLYMYKLGLDDVKIGVIISAGLFVQLITAFISGTLTDIYGRRKLTLITDFLSWPLPCIIWMLARNFWWFLAAAILNAVLQIPTLSWSCLMVEDLEEKRINGVYTWIFIGGMLSGLFVPLGGLLVGWLTIVPAMRIMYFIFFACMTVKIIVLYLFSTETKRGIIRMAETKDKSFFSLLGQNYKIMLRIIRSKRMLVTLAVLVLLNIVTTVNGSFYSLLMTQSLNMPEVLLAYLPILKSVSILAFMFAFQNIFSGINPKASMLVGILIYIAGQFFLVTAQYVGMPFIFMYVISEAFALSVITPRKDTMLAANVDQDERARIIGLITALMLGLSIPFGYFAGLLSAINRNMPFFMNIIICIVMFVIVLASQHINERSVQE